MLQQLLDLFPDKVNRMPLGLAMGLAAAGVMIGVVGARLSRSLLTLALVATGTLVGLRLPNWFGWSIDPMGTAFGGAILLGLSGYILASVWEAVLLGATLACGAGLAVWLSLADGRKFDLPDVDWSATAVEIGLKIWRALPSTINRSLPLGMGLGFAIGLFLLICWPRFGRVLLYSLVGIALFVLSGSIGMRQRHPDFPDSIVKDPTAQCSVFGAMVLVAAVAQWLFLPRERKEKATSDKQAPEMTLVVATPPAPPQRPAVKPPPLPAQHSAGAGTDPFLDPQPPPPIRPAKFPTKIK